MKQNKTLYSYVYNSILNQIISCNYMTGDSLPAISDLAEHYNVAIVTVRTALRNLHKDGYIRMAQGKTQSSSSTTLNWKETKHIGNVSPNGKNH